MLWNSAVTKQVFNAMGVIFTKPCNISDTATTTVNDYYYHYLVLLLRQQLPLLRLELLLLLLLLQPALT